MFHNCSLMLQSDTNKREGGQFVLLDDKKVSPRAVIQSAAPHLCLPPLTPLSSYLRLHLCRPSVLYLDFFLTISCCLLDALLSSHLHLAPVFPVASHVQFHPSFFSRTSSPPSFPSCSLSHCLGRCWLFSITAPLLQINDLICGNKQVSSLIPVPSCPERVRERERAQ